MVRNLISSFIILLACFSLNAQTLDDAIRYGTLNRIGTARGFGIGGSMGAIGGDFGASSSNPAVLAMYKWSEIQLTPGLMLASSDAALTNTSAAAVSDRRTRFIIPSASYVQVNNKNNSRWRRSSFGIGVNRIADFNEKIEFSGDQNNSITQFFIDQSNFTIPDALDQTSPFVGSPAYEAFVTTFDTYTSTYQADLTSRDVVNKHQTISRKGGIDEVSVALAGDYDNKLHVGASLNFPFVFFKEKKEYTETLSGHPVFNMLEFDQNLTATGGGFNLKIGAKYMIAKKIHVAAAFHSPTWMRISEEFDNRVNYQYIFDENLFPEPGPQEGLSPLGAFEYDLRTPWRATAGIGAVIGKIGFVSSELEFVNHKSSKFTILDDPGYQELLNNEIESRLNSALALRFGAEIRLSKALRLRGGLGFDEQSVDESSGLAASYWSAGFGAWFGNHFFIDAGFQQRNIDQLYNPYQLSSGIAPLVETTTNKNSFVVTFGARM